MTRNVNKNSNKNIINIKIGDTKKKRRKSKKKVKPRQQSPIIISAGGSIPYAQQPPQPQIQNLHYNKRSDDYFREALAPREKYKSILNNVNTQTEYSNPLSNNVNTQTEYSNLFSNNIDTQTDNLISNHIDTQTDNLIPKHIDTQTDNLINNHIDTQTENLIPNNSDTQNNSLFDEFDDSLINRAINHRNNYYLQNAFSNLKQNTFLKDEIDESKPKASIFGDIKSGNFKLKKVETENTNPILDTPKASVLSDITSGNFKLKKTETKTTNPILDTPKKEESTMISSLIEKIKSRRKHLQNEESDDDDNNEWNDDKPIEETKKQEIFKETKEAFLKKMESEIQQKNEQIKKDNSNYQKLSKLLDEIDVNTNVSKRGDTSKQRTEINKLLKDLGEPSLKNLTKGDKIKTVLVNIKEKIDIKKEELEKLRKKQNEEHYKPTANTIHRIQNSTSDNAQTTSLNSFV